MSRILHSVNDLQEYLTVLNKKAEHHAQSVEAITLMLAGSVVMLKNSGSDIRVLERNGETKNLMWVEINGNKYAFAYNGSNKSVEIRQDNMKGSVLISLNDNMQIREVYSIMKSL